MSATSTHISTREEIVAERLRLITARPDFPAFSQHVLEIMRAAADESTGARELTNSILHDYSATLKLLRTANSSYYNRSGKPIHSITHAVTLLGLEAIRNLAGSLVVFEHFHAKSGGLRELIVLSLLTAGHARETGAKLKYPRLEEAYLCGMFRNMGEVLIAAYHPNEYAQILSSLRQAAVSERQACLRVLEHSYEDLGSALARHWSMPPAVRLCLDEHDHLQGELALLSAITAFSHGLTTATYRGDPATARTRMNLLRQKHAHPLGLSTIDIQTIADRALEDTRETMATASLALDDLRLRRQMELAVLSAPAEPETEIEQEPRTELVDDREETVRAVEAVVDGPEGFELGDAIMMALEALYRIGPFERSLFGLVNAGRTQMRARLGVGAGIDDLLARFEFPLSVSGGAASLSVLRRKDLLVLDEGAAASAASLFGRPYFGLLPIIVEGLIVGCLYFDADEPVGGPVGHRGLITRLRDAIARAIRRKRQG